MADGSGLSASLGVADATNGETFRVDDSSPKIYLARMYFNQIFSLSAETSFQENDINQLACRISLKYLSLTIGKVSVADFFDTNKFSHYPRTQFMSWSLMNNGAWDFPANTRGYTQSVILEYITQVNEWHYGFSRIPITANGSMMNWNIAKAGSHTLEFTHRYKLANEDGVVRLLGFLTFGNMGNYFQSIALSPVHPVIEEVEHYGNTKYGFTINAEQNITSDLGCFFRAGWNDGNNETWAFTEIDRTASVGLSMTGERWRRKNDTFGLAYVISGISKSHQNYLKAGGKGFMHGDGNLNYAPESLTELYYSFELLENKVYLTGSYQLLIHTGYNLDRGGPVNVFSARLHFSI